MNTYNSSSYQSTIDSQEEIPLQNVVKQTKARNLLRRSSKNQKVSKKFKIDSQIQIQEPELFPLFEPEVRNYVGQIIEYVTSQEKHSVIHANYMDWQTDINTVMREILVGWMIEVTDSLGLKKETLHLAVLLVDKYCFVRNILKKRYQVLGGACLFIAAKFQELSVPKLQKYVTIADGAYNKEQLLFMESQVLLAINFNIRQNSTLTLFQIKGKQSKLSKSTLQLGNFLLEMCLIEFGFCRLKPTYLSLAIVYVAKRLKKKKISKVKEFVGENGLEEQTFYNYLDNVMELFNYKHMPKFSPVRKRYEKLFDINGFLK